MATNSTQIIPPRVDLTDPLTGKISREWYRFFYNQYTLLGEGTGIVPVIHGGTGLSSVPTNGQLLIGNGTGYSLRTLTAGTGISITNGVGAVTIGNAGVVSFSGGTTGLTPATATTGAVVLGGTLTIANGGTNTSATPTAYGISYGTGTAYAFTAAGTNKQALLANTGGAPTWATLTTGSSILYGDGSGGFNNVTIGSGVSFSGGTLSATGLGGTVTSVSVVSANGFAGTVATATTTPAITLTTSITGLLYGNGTALGAATINAPLSYSAGTLSITQATTSTSGYLSSTDWNTFNNKQTTSAPVTYTANFSVAATDAWIINNKSGSSCTATLPAASSYSGRVLHFQNYQAQTLVSASSNVIPLAGGAAGTSILLASSGDSATLVSDGSNWLMTQYVPNNILLLE